MKVKLSKVQFKQAIRVGRDNIPGIASTINGQHKDWKIECNGDLVTIHSLNEVVLVPLSNILWMVPSVEVKE